MSSREARAQWDARPGFLHIHCHLRRRVEATYKMVNQELKSELCYEMSTLKAHVN